MDLILWRHADAEEGERDMARKLTPKGRKQAARMGKWLRARLPSKVTLYSSPARRARETADALGLRYRISDRLAPGASVSAILKVAGWPDGKGVAILVGHQPDLGEAVATLVVGRPLDLSIRKGALWWISQRKRTGNARVVVLAAIAPDLL